MNDEIQEIDELDDFVCQECGHELEEVHERKKKSNRGPLIIIGAIVAIGIIIALTFLLPGDEADDTIIEPIVLSQPQDSVNVTPEVVVNRNDTLVIITEEKKGESPEKDLEEGTEEVVDPDTVTVATTSTVTSKSVQATKSTQTSSTSTTTSAHKLSYGSWTGGWKNGQPHGTGTMTYSTSHTIDSRDTKGRIAQPGEYIVGEWDQGHLVQGRWFKKDGTKEAVIIGKAG